MGNVLGGTSLLVGAVAFVPGLEPLGLVAIALGMSSGALTCLNDPGAADCRRARAGNILSVVGMSTPLVGALSWFVDFVNYVEGYVWAQ